MTDDTLHLLVVSVVSHRESVSTMPVEYVSDVNPENSEEGGWTETYAISVSIDRACNVDSNTSTIVHKDDAVAGVASLLLQESDLPQSEQLIGRLDSDYELRLVEV